MLKYIYMYLLDSCQNDCNTWFAKNDLYRPIHYLADKEGSVMCNYISTYYSLKHV